MLLEKGAAVNIPAKNGELARNRANEEGKFQVSIIDLGHTKVVEMPRRD